MQAVIMAGGKGTRLVELTKDEIPKPMVLLKGKPLLQWQVEELKKYGIKDIIMIIGHLGEKIEDYFGDGTKFGVRISYIREIKPLGTAGAFYYLRDKLDGDNFILVFGDVLFSIDINRMIKFHYDNKSDITLFVHPNSHPYDSDIVVMDADFKVKAFDSKQNIRNYWYNNCVNAGFYIIKKSVCEQVKEPIKCDLEKNVIVPLIEKGDKVYGYHSPEYIKDVGTMERIRQAENDIDVGYITKKNLAHKQKCIFLDRDGTINKFKGLICNVQDFELEETVAEAIGLINNSDYLAIVITNQPVVARGMCDIADVEKIHQKMSTLLGNEGKFLDDVFYCPHHPDKGYPEENPIYKVECNCRKPKIGMIEQAVVRYNIDLNNSWMIGDTTIDIQTAVNAGMKSILLNTGEGGEDGKYDVVATYEAKNLLKAVKIILNL